MNTRSKGGLGLIALLVVALIIVAAAAMYFGGKGGVGTVSKDSELLDQQSTKKTVAGQAIDTAKAADCRERLSQIRRGIAGYKMTASEQNPPALADIGMGVGPNYFNCPVSNQPYVYDPATGSIHCPTHDNF